MCKFGAYWDNNNCIICTDEKITSNIKPEIGKIRPVVVVHAHKRCKLALVIPFTTKRPEKEVRYTAHVPAGIMPGVLAREECWALCDMVSVVCLDRLENVYSGEKNKYARLIKAPDSKISEKYFSEIQKIVKTLF